MITTIRAELQDENFDFNTGRIYINGIGLVVPVDKILDTNFFMQCMDGRNPNPEILLNFPTLIAEDDNAHYVTICYDTCSTFIHRVYKIDYLLKINDKDVDLVSVG